MKKQFVLLLAVFGKLFHSIGPVFGQQAV